MSIHDYINESKRDNIAHIHMPTRTQSTTITNKQANKQTKNFIMKYDGMNKLKETAFESKCKSNLNMALHNLTCEPRPLVERMRTK